MKSKTNLVKLLLSQIKSSSRSAKDKRGFGSDKVKIVSITESDLYSILEKQNWRCAKTGIAFPLFDNRILERERDSFGIVSQTIASPDRIDSNEGYTKDNIQIVCMGYNQLKNKYSDKMAMSFIEMIKNPPTKNVVYSKKTTNIVNNFF